MAVAITMKLGPIQPASGGSTTRNTPHVNKSATRAARRRTSPTRANSSGPIISRFATRSPSLADPRRGEAKKQIDSNDEGHQPPKLHEGAPEALAVTTPSGQSLGSMPTSSAGRAVGELLLPAPRLADPELVGPAT